MKTVATVPLIVNAAQTPAYLIHALPLADQPNIMARMMIIAIAPTTKNAIQGIATITIAFPSAVK
jgi:hypothetical protein